MLRVELLGHGGNAAACDGLLAAGAQRAPPLMIVHLTVGLPVVLKEAAVDKRCEAFLPGRSEGGKRQGAQAGAGAQAAPSLMGRRQSR